MPEYKQPIMSVEKKDKRIGRPFVTISYEVGAYGISVVESLCQYLRKYENRKENVWKVFDKDLAMKVVEDCNLKESVLPYFSESTAPEIEDTIELMVGLHPGRNALVYKMNQTVLHLSELGYVGYICN